VAENETQNILSSLQNSYAAASSSGSKYLHLQAAIFQTTHKGTREIEKEEQMAAPPTETSNKHL